MGIRINTNIISLKAQRNLGITTKALGQALERLSSGQRINRAGDDAAGLAISEGLQSQVRGLRVAVRSANDAVGFLNTAEGALSEITNITQRLRELAIQAANGTLSVTDRGYLEDEKDGLIAEFDRIAEQTQFNGVSLLDGSFQTTSLQVGVNKGETISFTIGDARASSLGALATISGYQGLITQSALSTVSINGIAMSAATSADDTNSFVGNAYSAIALARKINEKRSQTGVKAEVQETIIKFTDTRFSNTFFGGTIDTGFKINNVTISGTGINSAQRFIDAVNDFSNATGVKARFQSGGSGENDIELYAEDGRNIQMALSAQTSNLFVSDTISTTFVGAMFGGFSANITDNLSDTGLFDNANMLSNIFTTGLFSAIIRTGAIKLVSSTDIVVTGTALTGIVGFQQGNYSIDTLTAVNTIDLTTADNAADGLAIVDAALSQIAGLRASLGAVQNRLDSTASNIGVTLENISAARSQIRDADIAAETAELTRAQILQQAGIAVLGQANTTAQAALSLLKF